MSTCPACGHTTLGPLICERPECWHHADAPSPGGVDQRPHQPTSPATTS